MANKKLFKTLGAITTGALILATPSCTDTWDEHYNDLGTAAGQNLWEQIQSKPELSIFAEIASKAKYYKDDVHPMNDYTFADLLQSGQVMTVWAPENSAFTAEEKAKWLEMAETDGYNLQKQLLTNHISMWRHPISIAKKDTLNMTNGKEMVFDMTTTPATMYGVELAQHNIAASNGTLHTVKGILPFHFNFYEYLKFSGENPLFSQYVIDKDTTYFFEGSSIEGLPDENGNPTYVDSVYRTSNLMFSRSANVSTSTSDKRHMSQKGFAASLDWESGKYIMAIPTDAAWTNTYEKIKSLYTYAESYIDREKSGAKETVMRPSENPDSLTDLSVKMDIATPIVFDLDRQGKIGGEEGAPWTMEQFIASKGTEAEYFLNTRGDTLRSIENKWDKTELFPGEPVEMSNGYAYISDTWNLPKEYYFPDVEIKPYSYMFNLYSETFKGSVSSETFTNSLYPEIVAKYGKVSKDQFMIMKPDGSTKPEGNLILTGNYDLAYNRNAQVMSGKYDIYMVLVPYWYKEILDKGNDSLYLDSAYVDSVANICKNKLKLQVIYDNGTKNGGKGKSIKVDWDARKVDTVLVIPDMEFPYSYQNLEHSYPIMSIVSDASNSDVKKGYIRELCIDRVILKSKEDDTVVEVDPSNN
ncbi:MAG: fasciclin domain-containing protein [Bacteroidaceae bacterium]|nr:fasciclin domain-containing protein [Bacteroidaceae bacterium]